MKSDDPNYKILSGTVKYWTNFVAATTWRESLAILKVLGNYHIDGILLLQNGSWQTIQGRKLPISLKCRMRKLTFPIQFSGGPPLTTAIGYKYYHGCPQSFVVDRILRTCQRIGKAQTQRRVLHAVTKIRKIESENYEQPRVLSK